MGLPSYERRRDEPLLDLRFFRSVRSSGATLSAVCAFAALGGFLFLNTLYLQEVRGYSALRAGLYTLPMAAMTVLLAPLSGRIVAARGPRLPIVVAGIATIASGIMLARLTADTSSGYLILSYVIFGIGSGLVNPPVTNTAVSGMPRSQAGAAAGIASTSRQVGTALGVAVAGSAALSALHGPFRPGLAEASHVGRWRLLAAIAVAVTSATSQDGGLPHGAKQGLFYGILLFFNISVAVGFTWFASVSYERNERRKQALAELGVANRKLEATLAENAGLHEQLLTQAREAGIMDERQRMAREIHDTLAQGLTGIITQLQAAAQAGRQADRDRRVEAAIRLARESLSEARRSVHELRPEPLETARLGEALGEVARRWSALHGVPAQVTTTGVLRPMPQDVEVTLLRTAQKALANVARHANATPAGPTLSSMEAGGPPQVSDDGAGFDPPG